jgi:hypothetical protein
VLHFQLIRYLVAVGSVASKDRAELAERFKLPNGNATTSAFLSTVKALLATAESQKELLVQEAGGHRDSRAPERARRFTPQLVTRRIGA